MTNLIFKIVCLVCAGVPSAPGQVIASRNTKTSAFVQWEAPKHTNNLMGYYVDASVIGSKAWFPCNHRPWLGELKNLTEGLQEHGTAYESRTKCCRVTPS